MILLQRRSSERHKGRSTYLHAKKSLLNGLAQNSEESGTPAYYYRNQVTRTNRSSACSRWIALSELSKI